MFGIATVKETYEFYKRGLPLSGPPLPFSTRQWEYPWAYLRLMDANLKADGLILDVGCGTNPFMLKLAQKGFKITGLDRYSKNDPRNPDPVNLGFDRALENENLTFLKGDLTNIPLMKNDLDAVLCLDILDDCDDETREKGLKEMIRVLKPGGLLIVTQRYIPQPITDLSGILKPSAKTQDHDFRLDIKTANCKWADPTTVVYKEEAFTTLRDQGMLLLNAITDPKDFHHFTAIGWAVTK